MLLFYDSNMRNCSVQIQTYNIQRHNSYVLSVSVWFYSSTLQFKETMCLSADIKFDNFFLKKDDLWWLVSRIYTNQRVGALKNEQQ